MASAEQVAEKAGPSARPSALEGRLPMPSPWATKVDVQAAVAELKTDLALVLHDTEQRLTDRLVRFEPWLVGLSACAGLGLFSLGILIGSR
jgi:hypothetical protein